MRNTRILELGSMILVLFDILITLEQEIKLVWRRPMNVASVLYLVNRYFVLVQTVFYVISGLNPSYSGACEHLSIYSNIWSVPFVLTSLHSLVILRLTALFRPQPIVVIFLWALLLVSFASTLAVAGLLSSQVSVIPSPVPSHAGCFFTLLKTSYGVISNPGVIWIPSIIVELVVSTFAAAKLIPLLTHSRKSPFIVVLFRNNILYCLARISLMVLNTLLFTLQVNLDTLGMGLSEPQLCIASVFSSRQFLSMREVMYKDEEEEKSDWSGSSGEALGWGKTDEAGSSEDGLDSWGTTPSVSSASMN